MLDAGPIIHLDELDRLELLAQMGELFIPQTVATEAEKHRAGVIDRLGVEPVPDVESRSTQVLETGSQSGLHAGEIAALAWASVFGADLFISDDAAARRVADNLGYRSIGSLGVITAAVDEGRMARNEAIVLLQSIPTQSTLHVRRSFLEKVIATLR